jgi:hypothetical protein
MIAQSAKRVRMLLGSGVLLAALIYSILGLTAKPAYASSCDCAEEYSEAYIYCQPYGGIFVFDCPLTGSNGQEFAYAECGNRISFFSETCPD